VTGVRPDCMICDAEVRPLDLRGMLVAIEFARCRTCRRVHMPHCDFVGGQRVRPAERDEGWSGVSKRMPEWGDRILRALFWFVNLIDGA
jgi:hypothetical protein